MASILDQDFGSESDEGADFNPQPGADSDNESGEDSDRETAKQVNGTTNGKQASHKRSGHGEDDESDEDQAMPPKQGQRGTGAGSSGLKVDENIKEEEDMRAGGGDDEDEEEEEDDEDEEDEEEDAISHRPRKRARRDPRNQYLDVEAEVDEEDEGDEEDEDLQADPFIADTHPDDLADLPDGAPTDDRRHRELDREREKKQQLDAEEQAALLREKYGRRTAAASDIGVVSRRLLLPSVDDPGIWGVKCKPGKEKEIVFAVTKRIEERGGFKNALPIISAFERAGSMAGYVYLEARRQADVLSALDGIMNVYPRTKVVLVPIKEMPDLLRVTKTESLAVNGYVRLKRGKYAGDLAQIDEVETNGLEATLKIVPRLDYGQNEDNNAPMVDGGIRGEVQKRKRAGAMGLNSTSVRPPPRLFSDIEAKKKHQKYLVQMSSFDKKSWQYLGETYVNGYLIKDHKIQHLVTENVNPTLEEVTRFTTEKEDGTENLDLSALAQTLKKGTANENYLPGDFVEVYEGEQSGVVGKAVSVRGDIVTISVTDGDLRGQQIEVPQKGLRKRFKEGDHVKVIGGSKYRDEVGMVVGIQGDTVTLLSDLSLQEISVFSKDLREASDSGVAGGLGRYDIHDLVQLDLATVGCVTKVDRESLRVLDQNGSIRSVLPSQISNKIERRRHAVATDRLGSEIRMDDRVREVGGEQRIGDVLHIYRSFLFLHNREQTEDSGLIVVRATNVQVTAAKGGRVAQSGSTGPDLTKMNPALMRNGANGNANGAMAPPKFMGGRDRALGQTVTVKRGPWKGLLGIVKDTTATEARVELHTKGKTITVQKETLGFTDPLTGQKVDYARFASARGRGGGPNLAPPSLNHQTFGSRTPGGGGSMPDFTGSRTPVPLAGGRTPAWSGAGGRTPAWQQSSSSSARTPAWQQAPTGSRTPAYAPADGSRTVNPYADGSRTAYGGGGGQRTPAWNPTATSSSFTHDPFGNTGAGSRTPAYAGYASGSGGGGGESSYSTRPPQQQQQQHGGGSSSVRAYDAPTPGKEFAGGSSSAPTPGANHSGGGYAGHTPREGMGGQQGQTPKFSGDAPTPFGGLPETPGWTGDDDAGPRYEEGTPSP